MKKATGLENTVFSGLMETLPPALHGTILTTTTRGSSLEMCRVMLTDNVTYSCTHHKTQPYVQVLTQWGMEYVVSMVT